jgi:hypothetical protein
MALFQEFFSVRDIMDRVFRDLQTGDNLIRSIDKRILDFGEFNGIPVIFSKVQVFFENLDENEEFWNL